MQQRQWNSGGAPMAIPLSNIPYKNQEIRIAIGGREYCIVSKGQVAYLLRNERQRLLDEAFDDKVILTEEEIKKKLEAFAENCGYATLEWVLARLTPERRTEWQSKYRFGGVSRKLGSGLFR